MKNKDNWVYSNTLASKYMFITTHVILFLSIMIYKLYLSEHLNFHIGLFFISLFIPSTCILLMIYIIETKLKKRNGQR